MVTKKKTTKKKRTVPRVIGLYGGKHFRSEFTQKEQAQLDKTLATRKQSNVGWSLTSSEKERITKKLGVTQCPHDGTKLQARGFGIAADPALYCPKCHRVYEDKKDLK